jgi:phosphohistidine phosphatase SixA
LPKRRDVLMGLIAIAGPGLAWSADVVGLLRAGGCAVVLRHADTVPGTGDPPEFKLGDCRTQRNLSAGGQAASRRMGEWFGSRGLQPAAVRTSAWCRCIDTARLAFGQSQVWAPLNSVFNDRVTLPDQTQQLREALAGLKDGEFEVWVSHQVNITTLSGEYLGMGEGCLLSRQGKVLARLQVA